MIVLDANLLLYAYDSLSTQHAKARAWIEQVFSGATLSGATSAGATSAGATSTGATSTGATPVGLPWQTVAAFLRVMTNPRLPGNRFTPEEAVEVVDSWLEQPNVRLLAPGDDHWIVFRQMIIEGQASGGLITDAQLAALTIEYGGVLHTTDRDFARFPGLRWKNPLT